MTPLPAVIAPERRRCVDTRLAEMITGAFSISYGIQAIQPGASQWKALLSVLGNGFVWGALMIFLGALSTLLAHTYAYKSRMAVAVVLFGVWGAVVLLFSTSAVSGPPLFNGLILMAVALRIIIGALRHEKLLRNPQ